MECDGVSEVEARTNKFLKYTCSACAGGDGLINHGDGDAVNADWIGNVIAVIDTVDDDGVNTRSVLNADNLQHRFDEFSISFENKMYEQIKNTLLEFQTKSNPILLSYRSEFIAIITDIRNGISNCQKSVDELKTTVGVCEANISALSTRLQAVETQNAVLQRRLNRANVIINGLPRNIKQL